MTALRRCDVDLDVGLVRVRMAFSDRRSPGSKITLAPVKSRAGRRSCRHPRCDHLGAPQAHGCLCCSESRLAGVSGIKGPPFRRRNFNRMSGWLRAVRAAGLEGAHFHDLRHTGNTFAASTGVGIKDLMARIGLDSERAAMIYQHQARGADRAITSAIDAHVEAERERGEPR